jgi:hypothetical protein
MYYITYRLCIYRVGKEDVTVVCKGARVACVAEAGEGSNTPSCEVGIHEA